MLLINTHVDGYEEDAALAVTIHYDAPATGPSPLVTLVGPDGQVELVGELTIRAFISRLEEQLRFTARRANQVAEAA